MPPHFVSCNTLSESRTEKPSSLEPSDMTTPESRVIIVGGGVFGLSTALWLARGGYTDVTIFDRCSFDTNYYNPADGCDGASADINKIFRATYGSQEQSVHRIEI